MSDSFSNKKERERSLEWIPSLEDENRNLCQSQSIHAQVLEDDGPNPNPRNPHQDKRISISSQQRPEDEELIYPSQIDEEPATMDLRLLPTPRTEEFIRLMDMTVRRFRPPKPEGVCDEADDVNRPKAGTDVGYVYIEEALKGPEMNPTWRQKIFSQRPEYDDEELRKLVESRLSHFSPRIVDHYRDMHRYAALEHICRLLGF